MITNEKSRYPFPSDMSVWTDMLLSHILEGVYLYPQNFTEDEILRVMAESVARLRYKHRRVA